MKPGVWRIVLLALWQTGHTLAPDFVSAQVVRGRVLDSSTRATVMLSRVALVDTAFNVVDETLTDDDGQFVLSAGTPGDYYVLADRLGYQPRIDGILELGEGGYITIDFYLPPQPIEMEGITATGQRQYARGRLESGGFYRREKRGFGHFIGPDEMSKRPAADAADLLRGIPRVMVAEDPLRGSSVLFQGGREGTCPPRILVDGVAVMDGIPLEDVAAIEDIVGVEVYVGVGAAPLEYFVKSNCGVLLIWTG